MLNRPVLPMVVNAFLSSPKFECLYRIIADAAEKEDLCLEIVETTDAVSYFSGARLALRKAIFWDKDTALCEAIENLGIRTFNCSDAIARTDSKIATFIRLSQHSIPVPDTYIVPLSFSPLNDRDKKLLVPYACDLGYPLIVKEDKGSFGEQVFLVKNERELLTLMTKMGTRRFLFQRFISESSGRDVRINVVGGQCVSSMLRVSGSGDFRSNISSGGTGTPYEPEPEVEEVAIRAANALGCDFAGVDILFSEAGPLVCEVNSNPQIASSIEATGIDVARLIIRHVSNTIVE